MPVSAGSGISPPVILMPKAEESGEACYSRKIPRFAQDDKTRHGFGSGGQTRHAAPEDNTRHGFATENKTRHGFATEGHKASRLRLRKGVRAGCVGALPHHHTPRVLHHDRPILLDA